MVLVTRTVRVSCFLDEVIQVAHSALALGVISIEWMPSRGFLQGGGEVVRNLEVDGVVGGLDYEACGVADGGFGTSAHGSIDHELMAPFAVGESGSLEGKAVDGAFNGDAAALGSFSLAALGMVMKVQPLPSMGVHSLALN